MLRLFSHPRAAVLAAMTIVIGYQAAHSASALHFYLRGAELPFRLGGVQPKIVTLRDQAAASGLQKGDQVISINGQSIRGRPGVAALLRDSQPGDEWTVTYRRDSTIGKATLSLERFKSDAKSWIDWTTGVFTDFLNRWFGIALAVFVLWMRPRDPLAWLLCALLVSFGFLASSVHDVEDGWPLPWRALAAFYKSAAGVSWPLWMLLFGLYFPDPHSKLRLLGWTRWVLGVPQALFALSIAAVSTAATFQASPGAPLPLLRWLEKLSPAGLVLACACIAVLFINIAYKMARERQPDAKRRLRWLYWGMTASLGPVFLFILYSWIFRRSLDSVPNALVIAMVLMLFIFPATLAYVIVVQRAMDVRVALRQGLRYALAQRAMGLVTAMLVLGVIWLTFESVTTGGMRSARQLGAIAASVLAVVLLQRVMARARLWVDRKFFREQVETERVLAELGEEVRHMPDAEALKERVCRRVSEALHVPRVEILTGPAGLGFELVLPISSGQQQMGVLSLGPKITEEPYSRADHNLLQTVASQTALALENVRLTQAVAEAAAHRERLQHELEIAREVQERLLPQRPPEVLGLHYAGRCRPAQSIGGDAYDFFLTREGRFIATIADICGKGVPAALLMAGVQASLRGLCAGGVSDVGELMSRLNGLMWESTPRNRFATLWLGQFDRATGILHFASAGHGDPLVVRASGLVEHPVSRGLALGLTRAARYTAGQLRLEPGDVVAVCTDGVAEARNPAGDEFGDQHWEAAVAAAARNSPEQIVAHLMRSVDEFAAGAEQHDDLTVIVLKVPV